MDSDLFIWPSNNTQYVYIQNTIRKFCHRSSQNDENNERLNGLVFFSIEINVNIVTVCWWHFSVILITCHFLIYISQLLLIILYCSSCHFIIDISQLLFIILYWSSCHGNTSINQCSRSGPVKSHIYTINYRPNTSGCLLVMMLELLCKYWLEQLDNLKK